MYPGFGYRALPPCDQSPLTEVLPMQKKYVSVNAEVDTDGVIRPLLIRWHDGRQWGGDKGASYLYCFSR